MCNKSGSIFWSVFYKYETEALWNDSIRPKGNNILIILDKMRGGKDACVWQGIPAKTWGRVNHPYLYFFFFHILLYTCLQFLHTWFVHKNNISKHFKTLNLNFYQDSHQIWYSMYISRYILLSKNKVFKRRSTYDILLCMYIPVIWIRTDYMRFRIHKIWWIRIRIRVDKIRKLTKNWGFFLQICTLDSPFFGMNLQSSRNCFVYVVSYYIK